MKIKYTSLLAVTLLAPLSSAQAQSDACINIYPKHVIAVCERSQYLDLPASGTLKSKIEVRSAMWKQNPASQEICSYGRSSGVELRYAISELTRVTSKNFAQKDPASLPEFLGYTKYESALAFRRPIFSGVAQLVGDVGGTLFGNDFANAEEDPEPQTAGLRQARFTLSHSGTKLTGQATAVINGEAITGDMDALYFECKFLTLFP